MSPDALDLFRQVCNDNADALDDSSVHDLYLAAFGKFPLHVAKLALVLHCVHDPDAGMAVVPVVRVRDAIALADYYAAHAERAYGALDIAALDRPVALARRILSAIARADADRVNRRDLHTALGGHVASDDLLHTLDDLVERGALERERVSTGGRPAEYYRLLDALSCEQTNYHEQSHAIPADCRAATPTTVVPFPVGRHEAAPDPWASDGCRS
jgi:hypothetical protein